MLSRKHTEANKVNYCSGFFITTNVLPDFGYERDQDAIYRRLKFFTTKVLPRKDSSVTIESIHLVLCNCLKCHYYACVEFLHNVNFFEFLKEQCYI